MNHKFVAVRAYSKPWEADIARAALEAAEIPVIMKDDNTVSMNWFYSNAIGGVRLEVPEEFAEQAVKLLSATAGSSDNVRG